MSKQLHGPRVEHGPTPDELLKRWVDERWFALRMPGKHFDKIYDDGLWYVTRESEPELMPVVEVNRADDTDEPTRREAEFVARLFAASPDLLNACKAAIKCCGGSEHWDGETKEFLLLIEDALEKVGPR